MAMTPKISPKLAMTKYIHAISIASFRRFQFHRRHFDSNDADDNNRNEDHLRDGKLRMEKQKIDEDDRCRSGTGEHSVYRPGWQCLACFYDCIETNNDCNDCPCPLECRIGITESDHPEDLDDRR